MSTPLTLAKLSISMEEGVVATWLVEDDTEVIAGAPVVEVETDKVTIQVEAPASGRIRIVAAAGNVVPVEGILAQIEEVGAHEARQVPREEVHAHAPAAKPDRSTPEPRPVPRTSANRRSAASPAARRLARERGVDLNVIAGSGPGGRVVAADLERAASGLGSQLSVGDLRRHVLENISASWREIPHIHIVGELVADGLSEARRQAKSEPNARSTVTDFLIVAIARALGDVPELNGTLTADGGVTISEEVHLGVAIATPQGVVAPVIRSTGLLSLHQIAGERTRLVEAARRGALDKRDLGGATCTLSNLGSWPVDLFAPVVSGPQIAMIAVGRVADRPVAINGMLAVRPRMWVNVAIDHRGADGEAGGRFLAALEQRIAALSADV